MTGSPCGAVFPTPGEAWADRAQRCYDRFFIYVLSKCDCENRGKGMGFRVTVLKGMTAKLVGRGLG